MQVLTTFDVTHWEHAFSSQEQTTAITGLETGKLLLFPQLAFALSEEEKRFLSPLYVEAKSKNISYNSLTGLVKGTNCSSQDHMEIANLLVRFNQQAYNLVLSLFPSYKNSLTMGRTSFRPVQVSNRKLSYRKDDKRLHVDAFPATPNQGQRILRVFSNINPYGESRIWRIGESFETVARKFLDKIPPYRPILSQILHRLKLTKTLRSEYDHMMLHMHNAMKKDLSYQAKAEQVELHLPPGSTWIVETDIVSHAAMSGQYLLEQTFYLPVTAMKTPQHSPLRILERMKGKALVD